MGALFFLKTTLHQLTAVPSLNDKVHGDLSILQEVDHASVSAVADGNVVSLISFNARLSVEQN